MDLIANIVAKQDLKALQLEIAKSLTLKRKQLKLSRKSLSIGSGVTYGSLRRFEETGHISLENLLKIARHLDDLQCFKMLFSSSKYKTLDDLRKSK